MSSVYSASSASSRTDVHQQIQDDWVDRNNCEVLSQNIKSIADFLSSFDLSCRSKLATLNEKLATLEKKVEYLEARVTKVDTLN